MPAATNPVIDQLLERRVVVLTGKGGVGKSTTSAALALVAGRRGKKVLLVEVDAKGNLPEFFDSGRVGFKPHRLHQRIYGLSMQPKESMQEYLRLFLRLPGFSLKPLEGFIEYTSHAIPGLKEILVTGKVAWEERSRLDDGTPKWDLIIVDGAPTGHVVSQLGAARHLSTLVRSGPIHDQCIEIADLLADQARTAVVLVAIPEEMPVGETIDLMSRFRRETDIEPGALVINQMQPETLPPDHLDEIRGLLTREGRDSFLARHPGGPPILDAAAMTLEARERSVALAAQLRETLRLPSVEVPYVFERHHGFAFTRQLAKDLETAA
jgi:anion-transporting  ArsA/GET3 family ATPase